jgi:hypothetical protein
VLAPILDITFLRPVNAVRAQSLPVTTTQVGVMGATQLVLQETISHLRARPVVTSAFLESTSHPKARQVALNAQVASIQADMVRLLAAACITVEAVTAGMGNVGAIPTAGAWSRIVTEDAPVPGATQGGYSMATPFTRAVVAIGRLLARVNSVPCPT